MSKKEVVILRNIRQFMLDGRPPQETIWGQKKQYYHYDNLRVREYNYKYLLDTYEDYSHINPMVHLVYYAIQFSVWIRYYYYYSVMYRAKVARLSIIPKNSDSNKLGITTRLIMTISLGRTVYLIITKDLTKRQQ